MDQLKKYYLLCTVRLGEKRHIVTTIADKDLDLIFTKKEVKLFLRRVDGKYIAREIVVGGDEQPIIVV